jgi:MraZ protein
LREYAQLDTDVIVVGLADRVEVWSRVEWQRERAEAERGSAELAEHLARSE